MATFNAGLAVGAVPHAEQRSAPVVAALAAEPLDLLCVQEMWLDDDWDALTRATATGLPNTFRMAAEPAPGAVCTAGEVAPVAACARDQCRQAAPAEIPRCLLSSCPTTLAALSGECMSCLARDPRRTVQQAVAECVGGAAPGAKPGATDASSFFAYGGSYGTGLLTNAVVKERDSVRFPSVLGRRGALYARLDTRIGEVHAFCTHLTATVGEVPRTSGSWRADHRAEVDALLAFIDRKAPGGTTVVLGDLNTGPAVGANVSARWPEHYARFTSSGFDNPYTSAAKPRCTYCVDGPIFGGAAGGTRGSIIDHVLLRGFQGEVTATDFLRQAVTLSTTGGAVRSGLSDHVGVKVTLRRVPRG